MDSMHASGSTWDDIGRINVAIRECAKLGVDERVILAIIMQESHGYVGVRTTTSPGGVPTAGLMQCSNCAGFPGQTNLSQERITEMVRGGTNHYKAWMASLSSGPWGLLYRRSARAGTRCPPMSSSPTLQRPSAT